MHAILLITRAIGSLVGGLVRSLDAAEVVPGILESLLLVHGGVETGAGDFVRMRSEQSDELGAEKGVGQRSANDIWDLNAERVEKEEKTYEGVVEIVEMVVWDHV